jgi:hypothetical protein
VAKVTKVRWMVAIERRGLIKAKPSARATTMWADARRQPRSERRLRSGPAGPRCLTAACHRSNVRTPTSPRGQAR